MIPLRTTNRIIFQKIVQPFVCKMRRCIVIIQSSIKSNPFMSTMLLPNIPYSFKCRTKVNVNSILFWKLLWRKNCFSDREFFFWKFEDEGQLFTTFLRCVEQWNFLNIIKKGIGTSIGDLETNMKKLELKIFQHWNLEKKSFDLGCSRF